jgi:hypothetical protein
LVLDMRLLGSCLTIGVRKVAFPIMDIDLELGLEYWLTAKVNILHLRFLYNRPKKIAYTIL